MMLKKRKTEEGRMRRNGMNKTGRQELCKEEDISRGSPRTRNVDLEN